MARELLSGRQLTAFTRRYRLGRYLTNVLGTIIPTAQVDKHWQADTLDVFGLHAQVTGAAGAPFDYIAAMLVAQEREVLVHRVNAWAITTGAVPVDLGFHLFTPLQAYDPTIVRTQIWFPWLQPATQTDPARLSRAFCLTGGNPVLQTVIINAVPFVSVGPRYRSYGAGVDLDPVPRELWTFQDPPIRLFPFGEMAVQSSTQPNNTILLNVNFYYSEREAQGGVG